MFRNKVAIIDTGHRMAETAKTLYSIYINHQWADRWGDEYQWNMEEFWSRIRCWRHWTQSGSCRRFGELGFPHLRIGERRSVHRRINIAAAMKSKKSWREGATVNKKKVPSLKVLSFVWKIGGASTYRWCGKREVYFWIYTGATKLNFF